MTTIARPVTKTTISTAAWGIPITDQVNALSAGRLVAHKAANVNQPNIPMGSVVNVTGMSVAFTPNATHLYMVTHSCSGSSTAHGTWIYVTLQWPSVDLNYMACSYASANVAGWGMIQGVTAFVGPGMGVAFPAGSVTIQQQIQFGGGAATCGVSGWCRIGVVDLGPF